MWRGVVDLDILAAYENTALVRPALSSESVLHKRVHIVVQLLCQSDSFMLSLHALRVHIVKAAPEVPPARRLRRANLKGVTG